MTMINVAPKPMTMSEIKIKAKAVGIDGSKMKKTELIHKRLLRCARNDIQCPFLSLRGA